MDVVMMKLEDLVPYENNPRINEPAIGAVVESIRNFGWQQPIIVNSENVIISGHTRYEAAKKMGLNEVPVVIACELSEEQEIAFRIADNKTAEIAEWDFDVLKEEMDELAEMGESLLDTAFTEDEIKRIYGDGAIESKIDGKESGSDGSGKTDKSESIICPRCGFELNGGGNENSEY